MGLGRAACQERGSAMVKTKWIALSPIMQGGVAVLLLLLLAASERGWSADTSKDQSEISNRLAASAKVLDEVMASPKRAIPESVLQHAKCVAVFPSTVQVAVLVGAKHGKGFATCRTATGWSAPAPLDISGGSWGAQLGGQEVDLVLVVTDEKGMQELASGKFKMGIEASVAGGPVGEHAATVTTNADILSYSRNRGLFAGTNLDGSAITEDQDDARHLYGSAPSLPDILAGKTQAPDAGRTFVNEVAKYAGQPPRKQ
jgi:SH3 domain-containing YSC84-like protein 1